MGSLEIQRMTPSEVSFPFLSSCKGALICSWERYQLAASSAVIPHYIFCVFQGDKRCSTEWEHTPLGCLLSPWCRGGGEAQSAAALCQEQACTPSTIPEATAVMWWCHHNSGLEWGGQTRGMGPYMEKPRNVTDGAYSQLNVHMIAAFVMFRKFFKKQITNFLQGLGGFLFLIIFKCMCKLLIYLFT